MNCLWCDEYLMIEISWENIFKLEKNSKLCENCFNKLDLIKGNRCKKCSRHYEEDYCYDCIRWEKKDPLTFNHSIFAYNDQMKEMITKWKYRGDYILGEAFQDIFVNIFKKVFSSIMKEAVLVPIPLSKDRMIERGFNQAKVLADFLPLDQYDIMERIFSEKQSKKTRAERLSMKNPFILTKSIQKPVILVDDIYTTGTTLRHAGSLLIEKGCPKVYSYTLIRG